MADAPLVGDGFLSAIIRKPVWKINDPAAVKVESLDAAGGGLFFVRIPTGDVHAVNRFEDLGFRVVDTTLTLEADEIAGRQTPGARARFARPADAAAVKAIAGMGLRMSRLHLDPQIAKPAADRSRVEWAANFFTGKRGDAMVVGETDDDRVGAFLLALGPNAGIVTIDLIATAAGARRRGLGAACVRLTRNIEGCNKLRVGTQAANLGALRFYERLGFQTVSSHYVLHLHRN